MTSSKKIHSQKVKITKELPKKLITWDEYMADYQERLKIHNYEVNELKKDLLKCVSFTAETYKKFKSRFDNINLGN